MREPPRLHGARRVATAAAVATLWMGGNLVACGPGAATPIARPRVETSHDAGVAADAATDAGPVDPVPSLDAIAERAAPLARGMREVQRRELSGARGVADVARADARDLCARVAYAANVPMTARIEDGAGGVLAERTGDVEGVLAARGPVCVRRGGALRVTFAGPASLRVRFVAWVAP